MNADSYYEAANSNIITHPCQDYALSGYIDDNTYGKLYYGILSDGCSSSSFSEVGAQILCHTAKDTLSMYFHSGILNSGAPNIMDLFGKHVIRKADDIRKLYNTTPDTLDATLWVIFSYDEKHTFIFGWGDGVVIAKKDNTLVVDTLEYESNAPYYLSYWLNRQKSQKYQEDFGDKKLYYRSHISVENNQDSSCVDFPYDQTYYRKVQGDVIVCSDGVQSYADVNKDVIDLKSIVDGVSGFKRRHGEFMKSNMLFFKRKNKKNGVTHNDDVSCAAIVS